MISLRVGLVLLSLSLVGCAHNRYAPGDPFSGGAGYPEGAYEGAYEYPAQQTVAPDGYSQYPPAGAQPAARFWTADPPPAEYADVDNSVGPYLAPPQSLPPAAPISNNPPGVSPFA